MQNIMITTLCIYSLAMFTSTFYAMYIDRYNGPQYRITAQVLFFMITWIGTMILTPFSIVHGIYKEIT